MLKQALVLAVAGLAFASSPVYADLITNGGFETGSFSGWSVTGGQDCVGQSEACYGMGNFLNSDPGPHSGLYAAYFGDRNGDTLTQTVADVAGQSYLLSFYLAAPAYHNSFTPNSVSVSFGGNVVGSISNDSTATYQLFTYSVTGTGSDVLRLTLTDVPSNFTLDDVSLVGAAPEPATWLSLATGVSSLILLRGRYRKSRSS